MRKSIGLIVLACLLCACSGTQRYDEEAQEKYQEYVAAIAANKGAESSDIPFAHDITMEKETDGYAYEITIKEPITAMYQIEFMAVDVSYGALSGRSRKRLLSFAFLEREGKEKRRIAVCDGRMEGLCETEYPSRVFYVCLSK